MLAIKSLYGDITVFRRSMHLMGANFEISVVGTNPAWAVEKIDLAIAEIKRVEKLLSAFNDDSYINQINRNAGEKPVKVNAEVFRLIDRCQQISELTHGAFDITYFAQDKNCQKSNNTADAVKCINYSNIVLDAENTTVFLNEKLMRISFASILKGYAADRAKYVLQMNEVASGVINAGGDLITWGFQPDQTEWTLATADPAQADKPFAHKAISNMAIATAGVYEKSAMSTNISNVDPKSGFQVSSIKNVTIMSPTTEFADAMATTIMSIGINAGLYLINTLHQMACVIIDDHNRIYSSKDMCV
jgi:thiamine biosynthesis lipoprotein